MFEGLIGALFAIAILCIIAWAIIYVIQHFAGVPAPVPIIIWAVVGIVCLVLLAKGIGVAIPGM